MKCNNMDNIGNCCLTIGHISCTCRSRNERITALRKAELAATVPPVAAANNRSDEIACQLDTVVTMLPVDGALNITESRRIVMDCIAQLRAMR